MTRRWIEIGLKVPDNAAFTALVALRRLGVAASRVECSRLVGAGAGDEAVLLQRARDDESLYNPNLHDLRLVERDRPGAGTLWVWASGAAGDVREWRLFDERGAPLARKAVERARDALLCNAAIEEAELS